MQNKKRTYYKWLIILAVFSGCATPYLTGYMYSSDKKPFKSSIDYMDDVQSYFMWMRASADHPGLPPNLYNPTEEKPLFFHLLWWGIGKTSHFTGLPLPLLYHATHAAGILLFLTVLWRFLQLFFQEPKPLGIAFAVCTLGSGVGWYALVLDPSLAFILRYKSALPKVSLDLWSADVNIFYSLLACPHLAVSLWLLVEIMIRLLRSFSQGEPRALISGVFFTLILGFIHVYDMFEIAALSVTFGLLTLFSAGSPAIKQRKSHLLLYIFAWLSATVIPCAYYAWITHCSPSLASWANQNRLPASNPLLYLQSWGLPGLLALFYWKGWQRCRNGEKLMQFLFCWLITGFCLLFSYPLLPFAKRAAEGLQIPIVCLAVYSLFDQWIPLCKTTLHPTKHQIICLVIFSWILLFPTTGFLIWNTSMAASSQTFPYFLTEGEKEACKYMDHSLDKSQSILCTWQTGIDLPRYTGMRVYAGHQHITPDWKQRVLNLQNIFSGKMNSEELVQFFQKNNIGYIWLGKHEFLQCQEIFDTMPTLHLCFQNEYIRLYQFTGK